MVSDAWIVLILAPCILSWVLGEMYGAWRVRSMLGGEEAAAKSAEPLLYSAEPLKPQEADQHRSVHAMLEAAGKCPVSIAPGDPLERLSDTGGPEKRISTLRKRAGHRPLTQRGPERRAPTLSELHKEAQAMRCRSRGSAQRRDAAKAGAHDPIAARVLSHYEGSIRDMARDDALHAHDIMATALRVTFADDLPRISDVAPVSPHTRAAELLLQRDLAQSPFDRALSCEAVR